MLIHVFKDPFSKPELVYEGCGDEYARDHEGTGEAVDFLKHGSVIEFFRIGKEPFIMVKGDINDYKN